MDAQSNVAPIQEAELILRKIVNEKYEQVLKSVSFWILWSILALNNSIPMFMLINVKNFGLDTFTDSQLGYLAFVGMVYQTASKFLSGMGADRFGIVKILIINQIVNIKSLFFLLYVPDNIIGYYIAMGAMFGTRGISINLTNYSIMFLYGTDVAKKLKAVIYMTFPISCGLMIIYDTFILNYIGRNGTCWILIFICILICGASFLLAKDEDEVKQT